MYSINASPIFSISVRKTFILFSLDKTIYELILFIASVNKKKKNEHTTQFDV